MLLSHRPICRLDESATIRTDRYRHDVRRAALGSMDIEMMKRCLIETSDMLQNTSRSTEQSTSGRSNYHKRRSFTTDRRPIETFNRTSKDAWRTRAVEQRRPGKERVQD